MSSNKTRIGDMIDEPKKWYLDYLNNFITLGGFCDHYGLTRDEGEYIIIEGKKLHEADTLWAKVFIQIKADVYVDDYTAIAELLKNVSHNDLQEYLTEEESNE